MTRRFEVPMRELLKDYRRLIGEDAKADARLPRFDRYESFIEVLQDQVRDTHWGTYGTVRYGARDYKLHSFTVPGDPWLFVITGFHGEEQAGPLTFADRWREISSYAKQTGVGLRVYPCVNPSGFDRMKRYGQSNAPYSNTFIEYNSATGFHDYLSKAETASGVPIPWRFIPFERQPHETALLVQDLQHHPVPKAFLDLHQDEDVGTPNRTYAYVYGSVRPYLPIIHRAAAIVPLHADKTVSQYSKTDPTPVRTDKKGLVLNYHDGSSHDWFYRAGAVYSATVETSVRTDLDFAENINLVWMTSFMDLISRK